MSRCRRPPEPTVISTSFQPSRHKRVDSIAKRHHAYRLPFAPGAATPPKLARDEKSGPATCRQLSRAAPLCNSLGVSSTCRGRSKSADQIFYQPRFDLFRLVVPFWSESSEACCEPELGSVSPSDTAICNSANDDNVMSVAIGLPSVITTCSRFFLCHSAAGKVQNRSSFLNICLGAPRDGTGCSPPRIARGIYHSRMAFESHGWVTESKSTLSGVGQRSGNVRLNLS
jgi:hypothetical protein